MTNAINLIKNLKHKDKMFFCYKEDAPNLKEEPFNKLFENDKFFIERIGDTIFYKRIPTYYAVNTWDYGQLTQEISFYATFLLKHAKETNLEQLLWDASAFEESFPIDNEEGYNSLLEEMDRLEVNLHKYEVIKNEK